MKQISSPIKNEELISLKAGEHVLITGIIYTARDAAHKRLYEMLNNGEELPIDIKGQTIYYMGPTPAKPGSVIGAAGPTTSGRMDKFTPSLLEQGLKVMIGKGNRDKEVIESMKKNKAIYLAAIGGLGALISKKIKNVEVVTFEELGPEAIYKLEVADFPAIVINDLYGNNWYSMVEETVK